MNLVHRKTGERAKRKAKCTSCSRVEIDDGLLDSTACVDAIGVELRRVSFALVRVRETEELLRGPGGAEQHNSQVRSSLDAVSEMLERTTFELRRTMTGNS